MHTVYNPSGFFDMTPYPLIHQFTLADIGFELPQLFNPKVWDANITCAYPIHSSEKPR